MKNKFLLIIGIFALLFSACDPLEDEIDAAEIKNKADLPEVNVAITLGGDDYGFFDQTKEDNLGFASTQEANQLMPSLLANKYPQAAEGSSAAVTYDVFWYDAADYADGYVTVWKRDEVTAQEYADLGFTFGNFSNDEDLDLLLKHKYPNGLITDTTIVEGEEEIDTLTTIGQTTAMEVTYLWWNGSSVEERSNILYYFDGTWRFADYELTDDDYDAMGNGQFDNFNSPEEAINDIPIYMSELYKFDNAPREMISYQYKQWTGSFVALRLNFFAFDGSTGSVFPGRISYTDNFGYLNKSDQLVWEGDNTIKYTFSAADYSAVATKAGADATASGDADLEDAVGNLNTFGNFHFGRWTDYIYKYIGLWLEDTYPDIKVDGQKFVITVSGWDGSGVVPREHKLIYSEAEGAYIQNTN